MNAVDTQSGATSGQMLLVCGLAGVAAFGAALAAAASPLIPVALCVLTAGSYLIWRSVDWATCIAIFCLYTNVAVIAVKFHGVPALAANCAVGLLAVPLAYFLLVRRLPLVVGSSFPWLITMAVVQTLGVALAEHPTRAWDELITFVSEAVVLYLLVVNAVRTTETLRGVTWALCLSGFLMGGVPLIQQVTGDFDNQFGGLAQTPDEPGFTAGSETVQRRMAGPIGEKNRYGQFMLMLVPLGLFRLRDEKHLALRLLAAGAVFFAATGVFLSFSRSMILCAGVVIFLGALLRHVSRVKVSVAAALVLTALLMTPQYRVRLATLVNLRGLMSSGKHSSADGALKGRATEMGAAALVYIDHPVVGVGPGQFKYYSREYGERIGLRALAPNRQAHCLPLDVAAENGTLGLICLLAIFWSQGTRLLRQTNDTTQSQNLRGLSAGAFYMLAVFFVTGLTLHFAFIRYFWLMIGLGDAAVRIGSAETTDRSSAAMSSATGGIS